MKNTYVKMDQVEHVLKRPDTYVGSIREKETNEYVCENSKIIKKLISVSPAMVRIFVEPLSNAIDNVERSNKKCTYIKVFLDKETGETSIVNDGDIIPVEMNEKEKMYNHSLVFGNLLSSSNYDDTKEREGISGRNGYGVKLTNIFSKSFSVVGVDPENEKMFSQEWRENMTIVGKPCVKVSKLKNGYTKVTYTPDFVRFGINGYSDDIIALYKKYVYDCAFVSGVKVYFNDEHLHIDNFTNYAKLYYEDEKTDMVSISHAKSNVVLSVAKNGFEVISFVNGVYTSLGGKHVDAWADALFTPLLEKINKKYKSNVTTKDIKSFFRLFVSATVINPEFESQNKHRLEKPSVEASVKPAVFTTLLKWNVMTEIEEMIASKNNSILKKFEGKKREVLNIDGYDPANLSSTKESKECILILCEGLSAKSYAVTGIKTGALGKKGRDYFGIYALRGKLLNTRNASQDTIVKNKVISDLVKILGLRYNVDYTDDENFKNLHYGKIMILVDADSVTGDTPILLQDTEENVNISSVESLSNNWVLGENGKEYSNTTMSVWTERGWTRIKGLMRHKVTKRIFRVSTPSGCVDVTEDHSLLRENGSKITPKDVGRRTRLLHSFPSNFRKTNVVISIDDAYSMGLFWITEGGLIDTWRDMFYDKDGRKRIPNEILNSPRVIRQSFFNGAFLGDDKIHARGKLAAQGVYFLASSLDYTVSIESSLNNNFTLTLKRFFDEKKKEILNIIDMGITEQYVYDLETENHHFQAGVGELIVHNTDGIHISSLIQNFIHSLFPTLFSRSTPFVSSMQTPIVRVYLNTKKSIVFYDEREYKKYVTENSEKKINKKYYKGLGTSSNQDVIDTFGKKLIYLCEDDDIKNTMIKVFDKNNADLRKQWMLEYSPTLGSCIEWKDEKEEIQNVAVSDYLDTETIRHSIDNCERSIPNLMDGLKISQRKILYACFLRKLNYNSSTLKVAQLSGYVAEKTGYHHGEQNLNDTIVGMAHEFVGSNNIPLLYRDGQFGSRLEGGKDAANSRYIFTKLDRLTRHIFLESDDSILSYREDDGDVVEPYFYVPIIPMILVNGAVGIGTGWATNIPCFNPTDIIQQVRNWIDEKEVSEISPWYRGFTGEIKKISNTKYTTSGILVTEKDKKVVKELPVGVWTNAFRLSLNKLLEEKYIKSVVDKTDTETVNFVLTEVKNGVYIDEKMLDLTNNINFTNMVLFTEEGKIKKYDKISQIIEEFCVVRGKFYDKRRTHLIKILSYELSVLENKYRFLDDVMNSRLILFTEGKARDEREICKDLEDHKYQKEKESYDYLLHMHIKSFTSANLSSLKKDIDTKRKTLNTLNKTTWKSMWKSDLDTLEKNL